MRYLLGLPVGYTSDELDYGDDGNGFTTEDHRTKYDQKIANGI
jgi:hypothetical protein